MSVVAALGLGSNMGDRAWAIGFALEQLGRSAGVAVEAVGPVIETAPVGPAGQGPYLNSAALVRTTLAPHELLASLLSIERAAGRDRRGEERWGPRTLDLDLLLYGNERIDEAGLTVPHPRLHERRFVLEPLAAIASGMVHPVLGASVGELFASLLREAGDDGARASSPRGSAGYGSRAEEPERCE